jgi:hypothetical protein
MTHSDTESFLIILTLILLAVISYFLPTLVANKRRHADKGAIFVINLFLGWSLIGWVAALVWASNTLETTKTTEVRDGKVWSSRYGYQGASNPRFLPGA